MKTVIKKRTIRAGNRKLEVVYGIRYIGGNRDAYFTCTADTWEKNPKTDRFRRVSMGATLAEEIPPRHKLIHEIATLRGLNLSANGEVMHESNIVYHWTAEHLLYDQFGRANEKFGTFPDYLSRYQLPPEFHAYMLFHKEMYDNTIPKLEAERHDELTKALTALMRQAPIEITPATLRKHADGLNHMGYLIGRIGEFVREKCWREINDKGVAYLASPAFDEWRSYWKTRCEAAVKALEDEPD